MTLQNLIQMAERRIAYLEQSKISAEAIGDADAVARLDAGIAETQATLNQLRTLSE